MNDDELTTSDVLIDETKNFTNIYQNHYSIASILQNQNLTISWHNVMLTRIT